jgi:tetratricopeptide (TPR) repeat protein
LRDHFEHARQLWHAHDLDGAIAEVRAQMSAEGFDHRGGGHHYLGILLSEKHLYDEAVAEFEQALRLIPENPFTHYEFGTVLSDKGDLRRAVDQFEHVLRLKPDFAPAHKEVGMLYDSLGDPRAAISALRESLRLDPAQAGTRSQLGAILGRTGKTRRQFPSCGRQFD